MIALAFTLQQGDFELAIDVRLGAGVTSLFGPSGAGKTTILDAIAGLRRPSTGAITIGDRVVFSSAQRLDLPPHQRHVGYVPQDVALFPHMNVRRNMLYGRRPGHRPDLSVVAGILEVETLLDRVGRRALGRPAPADRARARADVEPRGAAARRTPRRGGRRAAPPDPAVPGAGCATSCARRSSYVTHDRAEVLSFADEVVVLDNGPGHPAGDAPGMAGRLGPGRGAALTRPAAGLDDRVRHLAQVLWDYHHLHHQLAAADAILVLCSHDLRVAERGAELFLEGWAPLLIFSGGLGSITRALMTTPEADQFAEIARAWACPPSGS